MNKKNTNLRLLLLLMLLLLLLYFLQKSCTEHEQPIAIDHSQPATLDIEVVRPKPLRVQVEANPALSVEIMPDFEVKLIQQKGDSVFLYHLQDRHQAQIQQLLQKKTTIEVEYIKQKPVMLQIGSLGKIALMNKSNIQLWDWSINESKQILHAEINTGSIHVQHLLGSPLPFFYHLDLANWHIKATPTLKKLDVKVQQDKNLSKVAVRFGQVVTEEKQVIEAGQVAIYQGNQLIIEPLVTKAVPIQEAKEVTIFSEIKKYPIRFLWPKQDGFVQVKTAKDSAFKQVLDVEQSSHGDLIMDHMEAGEYHWAIDAAKVVSGQLKLVDGSELFSCPRCIHDVQIDATGKNAVVSYDENMPNVTLCWPGASPTATYQVAVFLQGEQAKAIWQKQVTSNCVTIEKGVLAPTSYVWSVESAEEQKTLKNHNWNKLEIIWRPSQPWVTWQLPQTQEIIHTINTQLVGLVRKNVLLFYEEEQIDVDAYGRFRVEIPLQVGKNTLMLKAVNPQHEEQWFLRDVTYQP